MLPFSASPICFTFPPAPLLYTLSLHDALPIYTATLMSQNRRKQPFGIGTRQGIGIRMTYASGHNTNENLSGLGSGNFDFLDRQGFACFPGNCSARFHESSDWLVPADGSPAGPLWHDNTTDCAGPEESFFRLWSFYSDIIHILWPVSNVSGRMQIWIPGIR